jgi:serine/threonine-protein kinase
MIEETWPAARKPAERTPHVCGRYELLSELGRGTSGVVYKAHDPKLDRLVALKILRPELVSLDESGVSLKQRFHQEAVAAGRLTHPAIVAVHDVGEADGRPFMVMEYIDGGTLADLLLGGRPLPLADAVAIVVQVCAALDYAHRHGVVHRDIKPRNILVGPGVTKVTDFGTARILGASHTQTGTMLGTPAYMSPEMVRGQAADPRSDLFSLGVVLYETLTGVNPFNAADLAAVLYRIVNTDAPSVRRHNAELPLALDRVLRRALAKDPEARYATATDLANALRDAASSEQRTRTLRVVREAARDLRRALLSRPVRVAAGVMCLLALVLGTWSTFRRVTDLPRTGAPASSGTRETEPAARPTIPTVTPTAPRPTPPTASAAARPATPTAAAAAPRPASPRVTPPTVTPPAAPRPVAAMPQESRCLSVNALPFAEVYVDDRSVGYTPAACLHVPIGEHRVRFEMDGQRSPERLLQITARHTANAPMRLSYDFNTGRFIEQ